MDDHTTSATGASTGNRPVAIGRPGFAVFAAAVVATVAISTIAVTAPTAAAPDLGSARTGAVASTGDGPVDPTTSEDPCDSPPVRGYGFDRYGGWKGIQRPATGRFTVAEVDGRWWFFTPDGHAFYANGQTGIRPSGGGATATGANPYLDGILATHGSTQAWADATFERTCDLGIRTLGGWNSMENLPLFAGRIAYTVNVDVYGAMPEVTTAPPGLKVRRDVFATDAVTRARNVAQSTLVTRCAGDPWCIGVFVENEQPYAPALLVGGSHLDVHLSQPAGSPGKLELQRFLAERHAGDLTSFNATWGTSLTSFDEIQTLTTLGSCPTAAGIEDDLCTFAEPPDRFADRVAFEAHVAGTIAQLADDVLDEVEPAMLNLGPRLVIEPQLPQVVEALTAPVDVVSVNNYDMSSYIPLAEALIPSWLDALPYDPFLRLERLAEITGKPIFVSEWFYRLPRPEGVPSHPFFLPEVPNGDAQAAAVNRYLDEIDAMPFVVGESWFQWADQPLEGRASDGENQVHGIVDIHDQIRQPLFDTFAARNRALVERRLGPTLVTTSFPAKVCDVLDLVAAAHGLTRDDVVRLGVALFDLFAAQSTDPLPVLPPPVEGLCEVEVAWAADDVVMLDRATSAWGLDPADLQHAGGGLVASIAIWAAMNA